MAHEEQDDWSEVEHELHDAWHSVDKFYYVRLLVNKVFNKFNTLFVYKLE